MEEMIIITNGLSDVQPNEDKKLKTIQGGPAVT